MIIYVIRPLTSKALLEKKTNTKKGIESKRMELSVVLSIYKSQIHYNYIIPIPLTHFLTATLKTTVQYELEVFFMVFISL